jgi:hypothetical protein
VLIGNKKHAISKSICPKQLSTKISQKHKKVENKNYSGIVIHVKVANHTDEYLIYHDKLSMLKSNMSILASINEWDIFTLLQVLKKITEVF